MNIKKATGMTILVVALLALTGLTLSSRSEASVARSNRISADERILALTQQIADSESMVEDLRAELAQSQTELNNATATLEDLSSTHESDRIAWVAEQERLTSQIAIYKECAAATAEEWERQRLDLSSRVETLGSEVQTLQADLELQTSEAKAQQQAAIELRSNLSTANTNLSKANSTVTKLQGEVKRLASIESRWNKVIGILAASKVHYTWHNRGNRGIEFQRRKAVLISFGVDEHRAHYYASDSQRHDTTQENPSPTMTPRRDH